MNTVTIFESKEAKQPKYYDIDDVLLSIKTGKIRDRIEALRAEADTAKRRKMKESLPCILFAGKFSSRKDKNIIEHSGFAVIDIDHVVDPVFKRAEIASLPYVYSAFISPSGDGVKGVVRFPASAADHRAHYTALLREHPEFDGTSINLERICFASYDPDIYINKEAVVWDRKLEDKPKPKNDVMPKSYGNGKISLCVKMIANAPEGSKHEVLLKASRLMGGYVAAGYYPQSEVERVLYDNICLRDIDDPDGAMKTIRDGIEYGKGAPLYQMEQDCQPYMVDDTNNGVVGVDDVWDEMYYQFKFGKQRGTTTRFKDLDERWTWKRGETTLIIGRPNSGKTEFILQLMLIKSMYDGDKWAAFSPENFPASEFYDGLIHSYIGQTTDPHFGYQMSEADYRRGYEFVKEHFFYVYPSESHTTEVVDANFQYLIDKYAVVGTLIDPFNQLVTNMEGRRDDHFLSEWLTGRKRFSLKNDIYDLITTHPRQMQKNKDGGYDCPDFYDISSGAMWSNKVDNILAVHRPHLGTQTQSTTVEIHSKKIKKQRLVGVPGVTTLDFDRKTNRYYVEQKTPLDGSGIVVSGLDMPSFESLTPPKEPPDDVPF